MKTGDHIKNHTYFWMKHGYSRMVQQENLDRMMISNQQEKLLVMEAGKFTPLQK